jgi:8-oxo-dGTP pyrophosphatase MutT (NUDIX family)
VTDWPALREARTIDEDARVPFVAVAADGAPVVLGAVARAHLRALQRWPHWLQVSEQRVQLVAPLAAWSDVFAAMNASLRADGLIVAWRDEPFTLFDTAGRSLGLTIERAATRFWGTLTWGAHCNGYVADAQGRPAALWIARRALSKPTDPGRLDNLIGGGVPHGQSPHETVVREGWEEAGLAPDQMTGLQRGSTVRLLRDIPEGLQREWIEVFDLALPQGLVPQNQDGEVGELTCLAIADALSPRTIDEMTVDAALVTLDFARRHRLLPPADHAALEQAWAAVQS